MLDTQFEILIAVVIFSTFMLVLGLYLLTRSKELFKNYIKNEWVRLNLVVWMASICLAYAIAPTSPDFYTFLSKGKVWKFFLVQCIAVTIMVFVVFNITWFISERKWLKKKSFKKRMTIILVTIVISTVLIGVPLNFIGNKGSFENINISILFNFYTGFITGFIYIAMSHAELERKRKIDEKELELSRMRELKTKAELEALHSKINPHFLYNALNSIADLSVTDGKKARKMTIALADLFRFSINYSNNNYSTIKEEVEMTEVYLQIEKIRFEDQLNYSVHVDEELNHFLVPRFILQPIVENAVKHGLKSTGRMTEIVLEIKKKEEGIEISVLDNGPEFPAEVNPGYGIKSIFDKLDLLFLDAYELRFTNEPRKQVSIYLKKMMKNEPALQDHSN